MRSIRDIHTIAHELLNLSYDEQRKLDPTRIEGIINLIISNSLDSIGIKVGRTQTSVLLKEYYRYLKNLIRENTITIKTPKVVSSMQREQIITLLSKLYQKDRIDFEVEPSLLGGIKIQNGWDIIDSTLENTLHNITF